MKDKKTPGINHHFRRESKIMLWWLLGIPLVLVALVFCIGPYLLNILNAPPRSATSMTEQQFWTLIEQAKGPGGDAQHAQRLGQTLAQRTSQEVVDFQIRFDQFREKADQGDVWAAGLLLNRGHGTDSGFEYFRIWLIGQGQAVYESALSDADSLADLADSVATNPSEGAEWESYGAAPYHAYLALTGKDLFDALPSPQRTDLLGSKWDWQDYSDLVLEQRLPRLWAKFGQDKQESDLAVQKAIDNYQSPESLQVTGLGTVSLGDLLIHKSYGPARVKTLFANDGVHITAIMVFEDRESSMLLTPTAPENTVFWSRAPS
ncbi:hypothetical protein HNP33_003807 [Comamonas odontotermitis]|uniref:DUF4240 domain-containing protein n=1 Tax=Comamonas odontotermitis TaxID=379895 RepID=A0ABR6RKN1_9BURK|nr:DUF4240 domain-containing protein [Comamonas odontotermitis]MBB6579691.1 hypothetical protein [Comamonas odontotermitis]